MQALDGASSSPSKMPDSPGKPDRDRNVFRSHVTARPGLSLLSLKRNLQHTESSCTGKDGFKLPTASEAKVSAAAESRGRCRVSSPCQPCRRKLAATRRTSCPCGRRTLEEGQQHKSAFPQVPQREQSVQQRAEQHQAKEAAAAEGQEETAGQ